MPPIIDPDKCSRCGICYDVCPQDVFPTSKENDIPVPIYPEECWHCNACVEECPTEAITLRVPLTAMLLYK